MTEQLLEVPVWFGRKTDFLRKIEKWIETKERGKVVATVNPEFVMATFAKATAAKKAERSDFFTILQKTDLNVCDGVGLIWARGVKNNIQKTKDKQKIEDKKQKTNVLQKLVAGFEVGVEILRGKHRDEVLPGSELILDMCKLASIKGYSVFFLGGFSDRAQRAGEQLESLCNGLKWEACEGEPKFNKDEVIRRINKARPDMLFVAYGMKKQEEWIMINKDKIDFGVAMGVGRTFDYYSGDLVRAPAWVRRSGFEWLYSLIKEPKRWRRQLALPQFMGKILAN